MALSFFEIGPSQSVLNWQLIIQIPITKFQTPNKFQLPNVQITKTTLTYPSPLWGERQSEGIVCGSLGF